MLRLALRVPLVLGMLLAVSVPFFTAAQTDAALESHIRTDLLRDPRAAQMSAAEFDALIQTLALRAAEEGVSEGYLENTTFDTSALFATEENAPATNMFMTPIVVALLALASALLIVVLFVVHRRSLGGGTPIATA